MAKAARMTSSAFGFCPECSLGCAVPEVHEGAGWFFGCWAASSHPCVPASRGRGCRKGILLAHGQEIRRGMDPEKTTV